MSRSQLMSSLLVLLLVMLLVRLNNGQNSTTVSTACIDLDSKCIEWARQGSCLTYPQVLKRCSKSCNNCAILTTTTTKTTTTTFTSTSQDITRQPPTTSQYNSTNITDQPSSGLHSPTQSSVGTLCTGELITWTTMVLPWFLKQFL